MAIKAPILPKVFAVFVVWVAATLGITVLLTNGQDITLDELATNGIYWSAAVATGIAVGAVAVLGVWKETGFTGLVEGARWWLLIVPIVMIAILLFRSFSASDAFSTVMLYALINTLFVGISEEVMFRGLLLSGTYNRFSYWRAIWMTGLLFGSIHILNVFITGELVQGIAQATFATMTGLLLMAIRLGMGSIIPAIIIHWLWDLGVFIQPTEPLAASSGGTMLLTVLPVLAPILFGIIGIVALARMKKWVEAMV